MSDFLQWMESGEIDLVVGTQMVGKGLDIAGLALAVVTNADTMLSRPDFRAHERAFQLLLQVAGRTGRREQRGLLLVQTATPGHPVLQKVADHDVAGMMDLLLRDRAEHHYPPFARMLRIEVRHRKESVARDVAHFLAENLLRALAGGILGPDAARGPRSRAVSPAFMGQIAGRRQRKGHEAPRAQGARRAHLPSPRTKRSRRG